MGDWQRPGLRPRQSQSVGVLDGDRLVAYAEVYKGRWADAAVAPTHRGLGLGTALSRWTRAVGARDGGTVVGQPVPGDSAGERLLSGSRLPHPLDVVGAPAAGRAGDRATARPGGVCRPRAARRGRPPRDVDGQRGRLPRVVRTRALDLRGVDGHRLATTGLRTVAAAAHGRRCPTPPRRHGLRRRVERLRLRRQARGAPRRARAGVWPGRCSSTPSRSPARTAASGPELSTDSRTGALGLYEKVGMQVTSVWRHWAADVAPRTRGPHQPEEHAVEQHTSIDIDAPVARVLGGDARRRALARVDRVGAVGRRCSTTGCGSGRGRTSTSRGSRRRAGCHRPDRGARLHVGGERARHVDDGSPRRRGTGPRHVPRDALDHPVGPARLGRRAW